MGQYITAERTYRVLRKSLQVNHTQRLIRQFKYVVGAAYQEKFTFATSGANNGGAVIITLKSIKLCIRFFTPPPR